MGTVAGNALTVFSLVGAATTGGASEQTLNLSLDGGTGAAAVAVPAGKWFSFDFIQVTAEAAARFKIEKSADGGSTWFPIWHWRQPQDGSSCVVDDNGLIKVEGGALVQLRSRVQTLGGAAAVTIDVHGEILDD